MRLLSLIFLGIWFGVGPLWAAPELLLVAPKKIRMGFYGTITARGLSPSVEENRVFIQPTGVPEGVSVPVTKVVAVPGTDLQRLTFLLTPQVLEAPPRRPVSATLWVVSKGQASNRLALTIVPAPSIREVSPSSAYPGDELDVSLEVFGTRLSPRGLCLTFGEGIAVEDLTVSGPTTLTAHLKIAANAPAGKRDVILRRGRLVIRGFQLFEVLPAQKGLGLEIQEPPKVVFTPAVTIKGQVTTSSGPATPGETTSSPPPALLTSLVPASGSQGQRLTLKISGQNTHFSDKTQLLFGAGISVEGLKVLDETHLEATITIAPEALPGPRTVRAITEEEVAPCVMAFNVLRGYGAIKGYVKDAKTLRGLSRVRVALPDYDTFTYTNEQGYFELHNIPAGPTQVYFSRPNYEGLTLNVDIQTGKTLDLTRLLSGDEKRAGVLLEPVVQSGEIPGSSLEALFSQGLTLLTGPTSEKEAQDKIIKAVVGLGGSEMGVLDDEGHQLNPQVDGDGIISLKPAKIEALADYWQMGETYSLADILYFLTNILQWEDDKKPTLNQCLDILNQVVSDIWHDPENEAHDLVKFIFSRGEEVPSSPPLLTADYRLNPLQAFFFVQSFFIYYVEKQEEASLPKGYLIAYNLEGSVLSDSYLLLAQNDNETSSQDSEDKTQTIKRPFKTLVLTIKDYWQKTEKYRIKMEDDLAEDFLKNFLKGEGANSKVVQLLTGKKWYTIAYGLVKDAVSDDLKKAMEDWLKKYDVDVDKLKKYYSIPIPSLKLAEDYSGKIMQALWQPFLDMYKMTVIQTATPLPPIIDNVSFNYDDNGNIDGLKITFYPSRTEERVERLRQERQGEFPKIYYVIYRVDGGSFYRIALKEASEFPKDSQGLYYFVDRSAPLGIVRYRMIAIVKWRREPLKVINFAKDAYYNWVKKFAPLPSTTVLLPLMEDVWSAFSDVSIYFFMARSTFSNEYSFYNNPFLKVYARIDVATPPPDGQAPYQALVSVTEEGKIYQLKEDGSLSPWADVYFAAPYQKGLAIDWKGWAYTENAASEAKFAGKIFAFVPEGGQGIRLDRSVFKEDFPKPWLGTIRAWSYFGFSQGFIYPVAMADLCYGMLPGTSLYQEGLFILEQSWSDIRYLPIDGSRQVATPLHRLSENFPEHVPINEFSRCQYNWEDGNLYFSFADEIKRLNLFTHELDTVVSGHLTDEDKRRFLQIAGFAFGPRGLIYLADAYLQAIYVYLPEKDEALVLYNLQGEQASPVDLDISADGKYLLVATTKGLLVLPKLLPYKVVAPEGVSFRGTLKLARHEGEFWVRAVNGYLLAPISEPTAAYYQDEAGQRYLLFFDPDTARVFVRLERPLPTETQPVEFKEPPVVHLTGAINYVTVGPEGGETASCVIPQLPWSPLPFIRVLSPWKNGVVSPKFSLYAVVSRAISRVKISLDYQPYREIELDPEKGGCLEVPFEDVAPGRHVLLLTAPEAGVRQVVPFSVSPSPSEKVLAGLVVEGQTGFPMQGLQVEDLASGQKTTVDFYGVFHLVVPQGTEENLIVKSPE